MLVGKEILGMETLCPTSAVVANSAWWMHHSAKWTKEENKKFESALAIFDEKTPNRWVMVASMIPGKSVHDVMNQYRELVADVRDIEAGLVPIPGYLASSFTLELTDQRDFDVYRKRGRSSNCNDQERKKGVPWTEEEHRRFLLGLQKHGKGDWRNISRNFVISKTPTQVASHAQKYYLRQLSGGKDKRRPSIHDITTVNLTKSCMELDSIDNNKPSSYNTMAMMSKTPNIVLEWNNNSRNNNNNGSLAAWGDAFTAYGQDNSASGHYIVNVGGSCPSLVHIKTPRFYG